MKKYIILILILVGAVAYLSYQNKQLTTKYETSIENVKAYDAQLSGLEGDIRYIFQIISDIDLGGITGRVRPSWIFWFNGGSLNNGTLPTNNSITYINPKGTVIINGSKDFGSTSNRPILTEINKGFQYYDSTLNKMILWNGTSWINLDGSALA